MATSTQLKVFLLLLSLSFVSAAYSPWGRWVLTSDNAVDGKFNDLSTYHNDPFAENGNQPITAGISCSSFHADGTNSRYGTAKEITSAIPEFGMSFWINIDSGADGALNIKDGPAGSPNYVLGISYNGNSYFSSGSTIVSSIKVPRGKWMFLVFYWTSGTPWTWNIISPEFATITSSIGDNTYPGNTFMISVTAALYLYEVQVFKKATISASVVTLYDSNDNTYIATTTTCPASCNAYCHAEMGCLSTSHCQCPILCTCSANDGKCSSCNDPNGVLANSCQCGSNSSLQGLTCVRSNFYTGLPLNCAVGTSGTVCTQCDAGYFLYDDGANVSCLCNLYSACATSCSSCTTTPNCFECANSIAQDGASCRVDSIGYQLSFNSPNIIVDFAHPLPKTLKISKLKASTEANVDIPDAASWTINSSSTSKQLIIQTNLAESSLPINLDFSFEQTA